MRNRLRLVHFPRAIGAIWTSAFLETERNPTSLSPFHVLKPESYLLLPRSSPSLPHICPPFPLLCVLPMSHQSRGYLRILAIVVTSQIQNADFILHRNWSAFHHQRYLQTSPRSLILPACRSRRACRTRHSTNCSHTTLCPNNRCCLDRSPRISPV